MIESPTSQYNQRLTYEISRKNITINDSDKFGISVFRSRDWHRNFLLKSVSLRKYFFARKEKSKIRMANTYL